MPLGDKLLYIVCGGFLKNIENTFFSLEYTSKGLEYMFVPNVSLIQRGAYLSMVFNRVNLIM